MLLASFFAPGQPGYVLLIAVFIICLAILVYISRKPRAKKQSRGAMLQEKYGEMTTELLEAAADDEVVDAVVANLMAKLRKRNPDPLITVPAYSRGRNAVYFVWMLCKEAEKNGIGALLKRPASRFFEYGIEGLKTIGADKSDKAALALLTPAEDSDTEALFAALEAALAEEQPLTLCREYIRLNPEEFLDA